MNELLVDHGAPRHVTTFRLGYADTDPAGILYYAAWFPFMERTQTEWFYLNGLRQDRIAETHGFQTTTVRTECDYIAQAGLFDEIRDELRVGRIGGGSFRLDHKMVRTADGVTVARASITNATLTPDGMTVGIAPDFRRWLASSDGGESTARDQTA